MTNSPASSVILHHNTLFFQDNSRITHSVSAIGNRFNRSIWLLAAVMAISLSLWGLAYLHDIFETEKQTQRLQISQRQQVLDQYIRKALAQSLHQQLRLASVGIQQVVADPLKPDRGLILFKQGLQMLPRPVDYLPGDSTKATQLYTRLKNADPLDIVIEGADPWQQRLKLLSDFKLAIDNQEHQEIRWAFRNIREHRVTYQVQAELDIPFMLATIEYFIERSQPDLRLLRGLVKDGGIVDQEAGSFGLQRSLLKNRSRFTKADFALMRDKIIELSRYAQTDYSQFLQQSNAMSRIIKNKDLDQAAVNLSGQWYLEPQNEQDMAGTAVDINKIVKQIKQELILLGLLGHNDKIVFDNAENGFVPLNRLSISIHSPELPRQLEKVNELYVLKSTLLLGVALLVILILGLGWGLHQRKQRFLSLKSDFISTVSHELRTPLAGLRLLSEALQTETLDGKAKRYARRILNTTEELHILVENILSFNRFRKDSYTLNREDTDLTETLKQAIYESKSSCKNNLQLDCSQTQNTSINADAQLMKILFRNLVDNACKYNNNNTVSITLKACDKDANCYLFNDNGIGIPKVHWQEVFDDFYRVSSKNSKQSGTGLGLAICRRIMEMHGGKIDIIQSNDNGSQFRLQFP